MPFSFFYILVPCPDCKKEISKRAKTCPNCGAPTSWGEKVKKKEKNKRRENVQGAGCLLIILAFIIGVTLGGPIFFALVAAIGFIILIVGFFI